MATPSSDEIRRRADEIVARLEAEHANPPKSRHRLSASHRRNIGRAMHKVARRKAEAVGNIHPARVARWNRGLSMAQAAKLADVAPNSIWNLENGRKPTSDRVLRALSRVYGVPTAVLKGEEPPANRWQQLRQG